MVEITSSKSGNELTSCVVGTIGSGGCFVFFLVLVRVLSC